MLQVEIGHLITKVEIRANRLLEDAVLSRDSGPLHGAYFAFRESIENITAHFEIQRVASKDNRIYSSRHHNRTKAS
jgi:hypothetical protein